MHREHGLAPAKKTKTGYSFTDAATLEKLRDEWPEFIDPLLAYREVEKLRGTYGTGLLAEVAPDGRIRTTFNQTVARTGRLSSDQPNLHNIPVHSEEGKLFRRAFIPPRAADCWWPTTTRSGCAASPPCAGPGLIDAFTSGRDHNATASRVFGVGRRRHLPSSSGPRRRWFPGLAYGMEAYGLGQRLGIPTARAAEILEAYFTAFPNVKDYMERTVVEARIRGYTETLFGRRRPIPELSNSNFRIRQAGERQAMNSRHPGSGRRRRHQVALVRIDQALDDAGVASRLVLQVHDEVLVEVPDGEHDRSGSLSCWI
ncbi:MAG: DNA polymerase [Ilumatobacteraceae bacterium]